MPFIKDLAATILRDEANPALIYSDLESECWLVAMKCTKHWTPEKGHFSTYVHSAVWKERNRIVARAMGFGTDHKKKRTARLRQDAATNPGYLRSQFWPRTQAEPLDLLERAEDLEQARALLASVDAPDGFLVARRLQDTPRAVLATEYGERTPTAVTTRYMRTLSEMALNAQPQSTDVGPGPDDGQPPRPHPDVL
jgi:hypothetical protein